MLMYVRNQHNIVKQLSSNQKTKQNRFWLLEDGAEGKEVSPCCSKAKAKARALKAKKAVLKGTHSHKKKIWT